jgi:hypothetical protein
MAKNFDMLYARPGMYLAVYDKKLDAGSLYMNFLFAIFNELEFGCPGLIEMTTAGQYFSIVASGCRLNIQHGEAENLTGVFDVANFQQPILEDAYPDFGFLKPIVWFTEYCLVDITTQNGTYRQAFMDGSPLAEAIQLPLDHDCPRFGFCFTLPSKTFDSKVLDLARLKQAIDSWKKSDCVRARAVRKTTLKFNLESCQRSPYNHYMKIYDIVNMPDEKSASHLLPKEQKSAHYEREIPILQQLGV